MYLSQKQIDKHFDGKQPSTIDLYYEIIMGNLEPTPKQEEQSDRYNLIMNLTQDGHPKKFIISVLNNRIKHLGQEPLKEAQIYKLITDADQIYGRIMGTHDQKMTSIIAIEQLKRISKSAFRKGDFRSSVNAQKIILDENNKLGPTDNGMDPDAWLTPQPIIYTSDEKVLEENLGAAAEEIDYEDVTPKD